MDKERRYYRNTLVLLLIIALAMAGVYGLLAILFREAFAAEATLPRFVLHRAWRGPHTLFAVLSGVFGWGSAWVAEQRGIISSLTVVGSAVVAVGAGYLFALACIHPLPGHIALAFVVSAVVFLGAGLVRQYFET